MLTNAKVTGHYRYRDTFQILPAAQSSQQPPYIEAHHPCILELKYNFEYDASRTLIDTSSTPEWLQEKDSENKLVNEIVKLIGLFSFSKFIQYSQEEYGWFTHYDDKDQASLFWGQKSYFDDNHDKMLENFTKHNLNKAEEIDFLKFYSFPARFSGAEFSIPNILTHLFDKYYSLSNDARVSFFRAATLFNNAIEIKKISPSISFSCFISCIETLVEYIHKDIRIEKCEGCGQLKYSVTKKFIEFMKKYNSDSKELIKFYNAVYKKRSKILHAGDLFSGEDIPLNWEEKDWEEFSLRTNIERTCRIALINWLLES